MELDKLIEQGPNIPQHIIQQFSKNLKKKAFFKPNILDINQLKYIDNEEEEKKLLNLLKNKKNSNKLLTEQDMRNKILENIKEQLENEKIKEELKTQNRKNKIINKKCY